MKTQINSMTRFGVIRHAQTEWNLAKRIQGHQDSPLTDAGERSAEAWGHILKTEAWDRLICSDLGRARRTAEKVNQSLNLSITFDSRLREQDWGEWVGQTLTQIKRHHSNQLADQEARGWYFCPPGGENRLQVWQRAYTVLKEATRTWPGESILIVTHEGLMKCLIYRYLERRFLSIEPPVLRPAHLHWLRSKDSRIEVEHLNAIPLTTGAEVVH